MPSYADPIALVHYANSEIQCNAAHTKMNAPTEAPPHHDVITIRATLLGYSSHFSPSKDDGSMLPSSGEPLSPRPLARAMP